MSATAGAKPPQYAGPVVSLANATPQQQTALERSRRENELASLSGLEKLHQQHVYEAEDLKLTGALYTQYIYNKDQAAKKDAAAAEAKKPLLPPQVLRVKLSAQQPAPLSNMPAKWPI